jgi:predicted Zn-dependent protease
MEGLRLSSSNPRLLLLAGESASVLGNVASSRLLEKEWYSRSAQYFNESVRERPYFAYAQREYARALDLSGGSSRAFPVFLRAIGRDPNNAQGYEYLAMYYLRQGQLEEAARLLRLAKNLPGVIVAYRYSALLEAELRKSER